MARYRDDGEVQIDNSTKVHFRNAFQQLIIIAELNVGTLLAGQYTRLCLIRSRSSAACDGDRVAIGLASILGGFEGVPLAAPSAVAAGHIKDDCPMPR
jgi:hypothetical protein